MTEPTRRAALGAAPVLAALLAGCATTQRSAAPEQDIFRIDDEATILAAAKAIIEEDFVAALITLDANGTPRARSVGVWMPNDDFTLWIGTRRSSRKVAQLRANPRATLYFNRDNLEQNFEGAYYASFMGTATVHTDEETLRLHAPEGEYRTTMWPNFPDDYAAISFRTQWLEVTGRGIRGDEESWQPQAVILPRA